MRGNKFINWVIKILGGITEQQQEELRFSYEKWAVKHLIGKAGRVTPDAAIYVPCDDDEVTIIRSKIYISNATVKSIIIAPWCKDVSIYGVYIKNPDLLESVK